MKSIDKIFEHIAFKLTDVLGNWPFTAVCFILLIAWTAVGPYFYFSDSWQLMATTPTSWLSLFVGLFTLAAANRIEERNRALFNRILDMVKTQKNMLSLLIEKQDEDLESQAEIAQEGQEIHDLLEDIERYSVRRNLL